MRFFCFLTLLFLCLGGACASLFATEGGLAYAVHFSGISNKDLIETLETNSRLIHLQNKKPSSLGVLKQRAADDIPNLLNVMHAAGYYDATVAFNFDTASSPLAVTVLIDPGTPYLLAQYDIELSAASKPSPTHPNPLSAITLEQLGISLNKIANAKQIILAQETLITLLEQRGYPYADVTERKVVADQSAKTLTVTLTVDTGPFMRFGPPTIAGLTDVKQKFIEERLGWKEGETFDPKKLSVTKSRLLESGLFSLVYISYPVEQPTDTETLPIQIDLAESKHRTISLGAIYNTHNNFGGTFAWETRNLRGLGEGLKLSVTVADFLQSGEVRYFRPNFFRLDQTLTTRLEVEKETTIAYEEKSLAASSIVERRFSRDLVGSTGLSLEQVTSKKSNNNASYTLLSVPSKMEWSSINNFINPTEGYSVLANLQPYQSLGKPSVTFVRCRLTVSGYRPVFRKSERVVFGAWVSVGSLLGVDNISIPPSIRFYAGSSRFLRGYPYKSVSPLEGPTKPIGGRSLLLGGTELRLQVTSRIGCVGFFDLGNVYATVYPQVNRKYLRSWGVGLRYLTPVGLLRADIAFPLDRRPQIDKAFQLYFSVGQAF